MDYRLRTATLDDSECIRTLIGRSIRQLGADDYRPEQIEAALLGAFGLDTRLISDGTYFVIEDVPGRSSAAAAGAVAEHYLAVMSAPGGMMPGSIPQSMPQRSGRSLSTRPMPVAGSDAASSISAKLQPAAPDFAASS